MSEHESSTHPFRRADDPIRRVNDWIVAEALTGPEPVSFCIEVCRRIVAAGIPLARMSIGMSTLHPLYEGISFDWTRDEGATMERHRHGSHLEARFRASPTEYMLSSGHDDLRVRLDIGPRDPDFPHFEELAAKGCTDFLAALVAFGSEPEARIKRDGLYVSWVTDAAGGFSDRHLVDLRRVQERLALALKLFQRERVAVNMAAAYLGRGVGQRVLDGHIRRGDADVIPAVVLYCDMRDSTPLAEVMPWEAFLGRLNRYFECTAGAVVAHRGDVLSYIGDAVLATFGISGPDGAAKAARRAVAAARDAVGRVDALNATETPPIEFGLALHHGELLFGNIGIPDRLDFSVIGPTANEVARLQGLSKTLGRSVLVSGALAPLTGEALADLGWHRLRGVREPINVFGLPEEG